MSRLSGKASRLAALGATALLFGLASGPAEADHGDATTESGVPPPEPSPGPTISGDETDDQVLTGNDGTWVGTATFTRRWLRCDPADPGYPAVAACVHTTDEDDNNQYTLTPGDVGMRIRFFVRGTAAGDAGWREAISAQTGVIKAAPPMNTSAPTIGGTAAAGQTLSKTSDGTWSGTPTITYSYQWLRCSAAGDNCSEISGATSTSYQLDSSDAGRTVRLRVTGTNSAGQGLATSSPSGLVEGPPRPRFVYSPAVPVAGQTVTFTSTSSDPDGDPLAYAWDLDGDGQFDDSTQASPQTTYANGGSYVVGLRVTAGGQSRAVFQTVVVFVEFGSGGGGSTPTQPASGPRLLSPFPIVIIAGRLTRTGARLTLLVVRGPRGSRVLVRCRGRGCPRRTTRRTVGRRRRVRLRTFHRSFGAGTLIAIYVRKQGRIGKYTRFRIRRARPPARIDRCLYPGVRRPRRCPST